MNVALTFNVKPDNTNISGGGQIPGNPVQAIGNSTLNDGRLYDDVYAEWDDYHTINAVRDALSEYHNVTLIEANEYAFEKLRILNPDIVFNIAEGKNGISREAQIPAILDMLEIPYTGSDPLTLSICLDKARAKEIMLFNGIRTPKFLSPENVEGLKDQLNRSGLAFPLIVKPVAEGSSKGIFNSSLVKNFEDLENLVNEKTKAYAQPLIIEEFLCGREFTVAIIGNNENALALPIVEIIFESLPDNLAPLYSYEAKWVADNKDNPLDIFACPATLSIDLETKIKDEALRAYKVLRCRDWARIDVRLDKDGEPNIIEINPLPGILPDPEENSCFPKSARTQGLTYNQMINEVLNAAIKRYNWEDERK